ncbi:CotH kinase family protein, partial [bacterium]|nr:CotH kinase family protein [bacterium]
MRKNIHIPLLGKSILFLFLPYLVWGQDLTINEVVSSNDGSLFDEDGDTPDWVEIFNPTDATVDLTGYGLSDDLADPHKWIFEMGALGSGDYTLVFASDKDRQSTNISWDLIIQEGDSWNYIIGSSEPPASWHATDFDDSGWSAGNSGIGYGDGDDNTIIPTTLSFYMRKAFSLSYISNIPAILFHMDYDDAYVAYMNGVEFSRENIGSPGSPVYYNSTADNYTEPSLVQGIDLPPIQVPLDLLVEGNNVLSIQVHNYSISSSDLTAIPFLSLGLASGSGSGLPEYLIAPAQNQYHTNFKISSSGEDIVITSPAGDESEFFTIPPLPADVSFGRQPDGSMDFYYFDTPTPGATNTGGVLYLAQAPEISPQPGFFSGSVTVDLGAAPPGIIYTYTLDGTLPLMSSTLYESPLTFTETTVLRVMSGTTDGFSRHYSSYTYFLNENPHLPVVSLIFEPDDFFSEDSGIYVMGTDASPDFPHFGANFWEDWERPIHIEYFEDGSELSYATPGGVKIFGGWSRGNPQRSLSLYARGIYGAQEFAYPFFNGLAIDAFESLVLRNSGNDWNYSGYRDGFMTGLVSDRDLEIQAFQPTEVFFNGQFWGIYNLREKVNEHFVASHFDLDVDDLDLLEGGGWAIHGDDTQYTELIQYVSSHELIQSIEYEYVSERVDIDNFIDYQFSQIYFDNQDWPGNNIKFWKAHEPGGKWRWILYDTDFGFGIWNPNAYQNNTLEFATDPSGPGWPNPPWSTLL